MKLIEIITESAGQYIVYQVASPNTDSVYYGYGVGETMEDVKRTFLGGAGRETDPDRGDVRMVQAAGGVSDDELKFKVVDAFNDEIEAFMERNDQRSRDRYSITGPTNFPASMFQRAKSIDPERVKNWKLAGNINSISGREAMDEMYRGVAKYTFNDIKALVAADQSIKKQLMVDLDKLLYPEFVKKYFPGR